MKDLRLTDEEFRLLSQLVYKKFGIHITEQKRSLFMDRLLRTVYEGGFASFKAYYEYVIKEPSGQALLHLADKLSTNYTYFFREFEHFQFLQEVVLPRLMEKNRHSKKIRIWSAGCSSGEEPYTLAMILREFLGWQLNNWDIGILATDISTSALAKATAGIYSGAQLEHVPPMYRIRYFKPHSEGNWLISPDLRELILFRRLNLTNEIYPFKGLFNVIFCRNVMIYFDNSTRGSIIERFYRYTEPEGYLFISHSESLGQSNTLYRFVQPAIYQRR
ncbi:protein-glutamate O-methyltransferase CheR [Desulfotomaculum defluvii]